MLAHYGVDVLDRRTSLRRCWSLLRRLPAGTWPDPHSAASWSVEAHLLAVLVDAVANLSYLTLRAAGGKGPKPKPLPRPRPIPARSSWAGLADQLLAGPNVVVKRNA